MRAPSFWFLPRERPGLRARLLSPLGALYAWANALRLRRGQAGALRPKVPVICVGNLNAGGTGKTPTVMALAQQLQAMGRVPHIVSRGYKGRAQGVLRVDPARHESALVGDEPLLLAAIAQVWVARDRAAGVRAAEAAGAQVILLDDGFQNPAVQKDLSIVVVDAAKGFGNGLCLPAGPLRESVWAGLARADVLLTIGDAPAQERFEAAWGDALPADLERLSARLEPLPTGMDWRGQRVLAFAGIAHPERFFAALRAQGAEVVKEVALDDHQPIPLVLLDRLESEARARAAQLVTTEKDQARLPSAQRGRVLGFVVRLRFDDPQALERHCQIT